MLEPQQIVVHQQYEGGNTSSISLEEPLPYVTLVSRLVEADSPFVMSILKSRGYRPTERALHLNATYFVRPLPLWLACRIGLSARETFWNAVVWLYRHGIVRRANPEGTITRVRDLRPWFMAGRRYTT